MGTADNADWITAEVTSVGELIFYSTGARWPYWLALALALAGCGVLQ